jgi:hypothetical protein
MKATESSDEYFVTPISAQPAPRRRGIHSGKSVDCVIRKLAKGKESGYWLEIRGSNYTLGKAEGCEALLAFRRP